MHPLKSVIVCILMQIQIQIFVMKITYLWNCAALVDMWNN